MNTAVITTGFADLLTDVLSYAEAVAPIAIGVIAVSVGFSLLLRFAKRARG